jgi:hypothetical protein
MTHQKATMKDLKDTTSDEPSKEYTAFKNVI